MSRPSRRARQKQVHTEVVGLLPEEQAALTKALYASLHEQTHSPDKNTPLNSGKVKQSPTTSAGKKRQNKSSTEFGTKKSRLDQGSDSSSDSSQNSDFASPLLPWKQSECRSPSIYGHSQSSLSSPFSAPSSPVSFDSPGGSLRLVLSTTSWSSDSFESPSRSSSIWSPGPSSPKHTPKKKNKKVLKGKKIAGQDRSVGSVSGGKEGQKGKASHGHHHTPTVDEILMRVSQEMDRTSGKFSTPSRPKVNSAGKTHKPPKQTPESKLKLGSKTSKNHDGRPQKAKKTASNSNNKRKREVVRDGVISSKEEVSAERESQNTSQDNCNDSQINNEQGSNQLSPCTFLAQRKFASNHTPPQRQTRDDMKDMANLQEIPKTEDFITFLCLRGAAKIPNTLHKFNFPWTPYQKPKKNGRIRSDNGKVSKGRSASKRLIFTPSSGQCSQNGPVKSVPQFSQTVS